MQAVSNDTFGPLVAYLVPGATVLVALRPYSQPLDHWFAVSTSSAPSIGGFLFLTVTAVAVGMTLNAIRWALIDRLHAVTGLPPPRLNFARLQENIQAVTLLIEIHYRHYQFYANMFVATAFWYMLHRAEQGAHVSYVDAVVVAAESIFFLTSRDTLRKYYSRCEQVLREQQLISLG